ncbi:MAG TPA: CrcB family protein [Bdellovibrionota bacterium]|jgi:CrcB protein
MTGVLLISLFGIFGVLCRYGLDLAFAPWNESFPFSTFAINIFGSFLAGALYVLATHKNLFPPSLQTALLVGFCGGFTTFSAYSLQTMVLLERGKAGLAFFYLFASPVFGLLAAFLPVLLARK